jgi:hypothetical protein
MKASATTQAAILERMLDPRKNRWSAAAAEAILMMNFHAKDVRRMDHLLGKAKAGDLSGEEEIELENYRNVGRFLELMKSRARRLLNEKSS